MPSSQKFSYYVIFMALVFGSSQCLAKSESRLGLDSKVAITDDVHALAVVALKNNSPIVVLLERSDCDYCKTINREFISPLSTASRYQGKVFFTRVSLDEGEVIKGFDRRLIPTVQFGAFYDAEFSPTILFLDGDGKQISGKLVGLANIDFYGFYLEQGIKESIDKLRSNSDG